MPYFHVFRQCSHAGWPGFPGLFQKTCGLEFAPGPLFYYAFFTMLTKIATVLLKNLRDFAMSLNFCLRERGGKTRILPKLLAAGLICFCLAGVAWGAGKSAPEMRRLAQAGASLIIDLRTTPFSVPELAQIAGALAKNATLTVKSPASRLSIAECLQIANARPGQVTFWFQDGN